MSRRRSPAGTVDLSGKNADIGMHWNLLGQRRKHCYERTRLTLKKGTARSASFNLLPQQERFDAIRDA